MSLDLPTIFMVSGCVYFIIGTIDCIRWWNGSNDEGGPK